MRNIILAVLFAIIFTSPASAKYEAPKPKIIAVYFYADWCTNCKILSMRYDAARINGELDKQKILFVKLDLTNKTTINQAILQAHAMGFYDYLKQQGSGAGYVAILDANSKKELARFLRDNSADEIQNKIEELLK